MTQTDTTYPAHDIATAIENIAQQITNRHPDAETIIIVGVANGGLPFGQKLATALRAISKTKVEEGGINITFHRDDIGSNPIPEEKMRTNMPCDIEDHIVILADDVIFSGRTARAAINEVFDQGRPGQLELAVLFDRGNRRLPIHPDYTGFLEGTRLDQRVEVTLSTEHPESDSIQITSS